LVDTSKVNNFSIQSGIVSDFVNPIALQMIIDSGYFNQGLADLYIEKIHHKMKTSDKISITRLGDTIQVPKFWSSFLVKWSDSVGMGYIDAIDTLNKLWPVIEYAHPNYLYHLAGLPPNDLLFNNGEQVGLYQSSHTCDINILPAWDMSVGKDNIRVGIFDTGINWDHSDLSEDNTLTWAKSRVKGGFDYYNNVSLTSSTQIDNNGHGSGIAGIIGAIRNNDRGAAGIAGGNGATSNWGVELYDFKIVEHGNPIITTETTIADAMREGSSSTVYSLNLESHCWQQDKMGDELIGQFRFAYKNNIICAAGSGNFGGTTDEWFPATLYDDWIMKVGASNLLGRQWTYSTGGKYIDFLAPGVRNSYATIDANDNNTYGYKSDGTSFAAPHALGVSALMLSYVNDPSNNAPNSLAPEDIEYLLQKYATSLTAPPAIRPDIYNGYGRINAGSTLEGIKLPNYQVKHYEVKFTNGSATKISSNQIILNEKSNGIESGTYNADVYEIKKPFNLAQEPGRTIIDVWSRNSSSTLLGPSPMISLEDNSVVSLYYAPTLVYEMKGYIYFIKSSTTGANINRWFPSTGLNGNGSMALSVYSYSPNGLGYNNLPILSDKVNIFPNPTIGKTTINFNVLKSTNVIIEISDLSGKVIYSYPSQQLNEGQHQLELNLFDLNSGMYIINLITKEGTLPKKLTIAK
jgi:hypothetical protein